MGPERDLDLAPGEMKVGMVVLLLGQLADTGCEVEGLSKILELV